MYCYTSLSIKQHNFLTLNIQDNFITFAPCYKLRSSENGKEKDSLYFTRDYSLFA